MRNSLQRQQNAERALWLLLSKKEIDREAISDELAAVLSTADLVIHPSIEPRPGRPHASFAEKHRPEYRRVATSFIDAMRERIDPKIIWGKVMQFGKQHGFKLTAEPWSLDADQIEAATA